MRHWRQDFIDCFSLALCDECLSHWRHPDQDGRTNKAYILFPTGMLPASCHCTLGNMGKYRFHEYWLFNPGYVSWLKLVPGNTYDVQCIYCKKFFKLHNVDQGNGIPHAEWETKSARKLGNKRQFLPWSTKRQKRHVVYFNKHLGKIDHNPKSLSQSMCFFLQFMLLCN